MTPARKPYLLHSLPAMRALDRCTTAQPLVAIRSTLILVPVVYTRKAIQHLHCASAMVNVNVLTTHLHSCDPAQT